MKATAKTRHNSRRATAGAATAARPKRPRAENPATPAPPVAPPVIDRVCERHRGRPGELLGILEELQNLHPHKFLPPETLEQVAERTGVPVSQVFSVATFYAFFNLQPQGEHTLIVCRGTACHTRGSKARFEALKRLLHLTEDESADKVCLTTADRKFTVRTVACFGQCAMAPVVEVDGRMKSHVTEVCLKELLNAITKKGTGK